MNKKFFLSAVLALVMMGATQAQQRQNYVEAPAAHATSYLTTADFQKKVWNYQQSPQQFKYLGSKPCIIDFYTTWCGPCKRLAPILENIAAEYKDQVIIYKVDAEKELELSQIFKVSSYPRMLFIPMNGSPQVSIGLLPKEEILNLMENIFGIKPKS